MKKFALIGYGYWGKNLLRVMNEIKEMQVKYVCDYDKNRLKIAQEKFPNTIYTRDPNKLFKDKDLDAIIIATPIDTHYKLAKEALENDKDVFVEKPLTNSTETAEDLVKIAKAKKKILMTGHTFLYSPPVRKVKEIIKSGELGDIYFITSLRVNLGIHRKDISVIWDLAPHDISIIYYWLEETPVKIQALGRDSIIKNIPDVAFINLIFPSKIVANIELSWLAPTKLRKTTIVGSNKMLVYDDTDPVEKIKIFDKGIDFKDPETYGEYQLTYRTGNMYSPTIENKEPLRTELEEFLNCIKNRKEPVSNGKIGIDVVKAIEQADKNLYDNL